MRSPYYLMLLAAAAFMLAECVASTSASLKGNAGTSELRVIRTKTGLICGPCMPAPGSVSETYDFDLVGERSVYTENEFRMFRVIPSGARFPVTVAKGFITVDRDKHQIRFEISIDDKPSELNGRFTYTDEKKTA